MLGEPRETENLERQAAFELRWEHVQVYEMQSVMGATKHPRTGSNWQALFVGCGKRLEEEKDGDPS